MTARRQCPRTAGEPSDPYAADSHTAALRRGCRGLSAWRKAIVGHQPYDQPVTRDLERFWLPVGSTYRLGQDGWLLDSDSSAYYAADDLLTTQNIASARCVVMLGEPGIGKSSVISTRESLTPGMTGIDNVTVDLSPYTSEYRLVQEVFEGSTISQWESGDGQLCLTLDSFDEAHRRIPSLHSILGQFVDRWDCRRLYLRIACRTADWPNSLGAHLEDAFGDLLLVELLPLRRRDVGPLLSDTTDVTAFLSAVESTKVVPLAARPLTLKFLAAMWQQDGALPARASELFERGLLALSDELNERRRDGANAIGTASQRLDAGTRLAALSIFGGRPTFWMGPTYVSGPSDFTVDECLGGGTKALSPEVGRELITATLHSGLFSGAGPQRLGWAHSTFADSLAARWICINDLSTRQVRSLLVSDVSGIPTQVRGVAAWLVAREPDRFGWLVDVDPEAFLLNVDIPDAAVRSRIVASVFTQARTGRLHHDYNRNLRDLRHDGIAHQLREALADPELEVRRMAIDIARAVRAVELRPAIIARALDPHEDRNLRVSAALAAQEVDSDIPTSELLPLVRLAGGGVSSADDQELQAAALFASWPHAISSAEVFELIDPKHARNFYGLYDAFISEFAKGLTAADAEAAAHWLSLDQGRLSDSRLDVLVDRCLQICLDDLAAPGALPALTQVMLGRATNYEPLLGRRDEDGLEVTDPVRRNLALAVLERATEEQVFACLEVFGDRRGLLSRDDFPWMLRQHRKASGALRINLGTALQYLYTPGDAAMSDAVLGLSSRHSASQVFAHWRGSVELRSDGAATARKAWEELEIRRRRAEERQRAPSADAWIPRRIRELSKKALGGDSSAFWQAVRLVTVRPGTRHYMDEFQPDLTAHPRWDKLSKAVRANLVGAAPIYLRNAAPEPDKWFGKDVRFFAAEAGYRALILLLRMAPTELSRLPGEVWRTWSSIMVSWSCTANGARVEDKEALFSLALPHARAELTADLLALLDSRLTAEQPCFLREEIRLLDSGALATKLGERLRARRISSMVRSELLDHLSVNHADAVRAQLYNWLAPRARRSNPSRARDVVVRLLANDAEMSWPLLIRLMNDDATLMEEALLGWGAAYDRRTPELPDPALADLFIWLMKRFPSSEDPEFDDAHFVGPREAVGNWRDSILRILESRGTSESLEAVRRIVSELAEYEYLSQVLLRAERAYQEESFQPVRPEELDDLAASQRAQLIRSDFDLLTSVLHALEGIKDRMQGDTPTSPLLWDTYSARPKTEDEFSDYLRSELQWRLREQGVVVNREVQVRRVSPKGLPERTDLRVDAVDRGSGGQDDGASQLHTVVGEVKCPWNRDLIGSIEEQLVGRYMADLHSRYGVYIVPWFDPDSWAVSDSRRRKAARHGSIEKLQAELDAVTERLEARAVTVVAVVVDASLNRPRTRSATAKTANVGGVAN